MEIKDMLTLVEDLEDDVENLKTSLEPLLTTPLSEITKKLPLLDRAKAYVLAVYAVESILFSYLRLNGVDAKEHPVFKELQRVKQYFDKIKEAEEGTTKPRENLSLNKSAARRIVQHALASNVAFNAEQKERELKEKILAARKLRSQQTPTSDPVEVLDLPDAPDVSEEGEIEEDEGPDGADSMSALAGLATSTIQEDTDLQSLKKRKNESESDQDENPASKAKARLKKRNKDKKRARKVHKRLGT